MNCNFASGAYRESEVLKGTNIGGHCLSNMQKLLLHRNRCLYKNFFKFNLNCYFKYFKNVLTFKNIKTF